MKFEGEPQWIEIPDDSVLRNAGLKDTRNGNNFIHCLGNDLRDSKGNVLKNVQICFVLIGRESDYPPIKRFLDSIGVISQFMLFKNVKRNESKMGVFTNLLRQVNAKVGLDLYRMRLPQKVKNANSMFVGMDVVNMGKESVLGMTATYNQYQMQYYSEVAMQDQLKEMLKQGYSKRDQEEAVCKGRTEIIADFLRNAFKNYVANNNGKRPE